METTINSIPEEQSRKFNEVENSNQSWSGGEQEISDPVVFVMINRLENA